MDRRDVLKFGALAGLGGSSCASLLTNPGAVGAADMGGFLSALDGALASILPGQPFDAFFDTGKNAELAARARNGEDLARKTLRSLLLVGTLQELPPEQATHEGVQERLRNHMGEFDDAMFGMTDMLENLAPTERANVAKALRDDPQLGMRIMGTFDQEAAAMGISLRQRTKLRSISAQACARLRQSPELAISEYTGKVRKLAARHGARAEEERRAAAAIGSALLWQQTLGTGSVVGGSVGTADAGVIEFTQPGEIVAPARAWTTPPMLQAEPEKPGLCVVDKECAAGLTCQDYRELGHGKWSRGECKPLPKKDRSVSHGFLTTGGIIMGLGAAGAIIGAASGNSLIGATVGAILGALGLLVLLIGLIVLATGH